MCWHCGKHFTFFFSLKYQQSYVVGVTVTVLERKLRLRDCSVGASSRNQTPGIRILAVPLSSCVKWANYITSLPQFPLQRKKMTMVHTSV